ncbi:basic proline-rich protein-like isoform X2 [Vulpes lagopus]|uniref:basic proline-rich protein-like isoform X2 n=1 Tax=Vulpes lagopus TaxID=494514 RepID=UPI001BC93F51|nr:basic proline-rich protein-like isoform X2 [Vulpes lagopus]
MQAGSAALGEGDRGRPSRRGPRCPGQAPRARPSRPPLAPPRCAPRPRRGSRLPAPGSRPPAPGRAPSSFGHLLRTPPAEPRLGPGNLSINGEFSSGLTNQGLFSQRHSSGNPWQPTGSEPPESPKPSGCCSPPREPAAGARSRPARATLLGGEKPSQTERGLHTQCGAQHGT